MFKETVLDKQKIIIRKTLNYLALFVTVVLVFVIQTSIFPLIPFIKGSPNLLLYITFITGFIFGESKALFVGLLCGILSDLFYSGQFGFFTLIYVAIGYANGILHHYIYDDNIFFVLILTIVNTLVFNIYIYIFCFLLYGKTEFIKYFINICMPSIVLTLIVSIIFYKLAYKLKVREEKYEI